MPKGGKFGVLESFPLFFGKRRHGFTNFGHRRFDGRARNQPIESSREKKASQMNFPKLGQSVKQLSTMKLSRNVRSQRYKRSRLDWEGSPLDKIPKNA